MSSPSIRRGRPLPVRALAIAAGVALSLGAALAAGAPASAAASEGSITDATLQWGLSGEAGGGAYFGGCNFLSAGQAGDTGSSRLWSEADGFYSASSGNVSIVKPDATGALQPASWATKCQTPAGTAVSPGSTTSLSKNTVVITNGTGQVEADGSSEIGWTGSFTVAFYGGMTYWTATNPVLSVDAAGNGQLTATASGYGTSMADQSQWVPIAGQTIVLADIHGASVGDEGLTATPDYLGVAVTTTGTAQSTTGASWGSFPQSFIDFQNLTGQSSYWYSSGGARDAAKPTTPLAVSYTIDGPSVPSDPNAGDQDVSVTVPELSVPAGGEFGWSFDGDTVVDLGTAVQAGNTFTATGGINRITVTDTRTGGNAPYSWGVSGQMSDFTSSAGRFSGGYVGWTPSVTSTSGTVVAGAPVVSAAAGGDGLSTSATLASSNAAASAEIDAALSLVLPTDVEAGSYTGTLVLTALS